MNQVPPYVPVAMIALACKESGMTRKAALGIVKRAGILERKGQYYVVPESKLREELPEIYDRVYAHCMVSQHLKTNPPRHLRISRNGQRVKG